MRWRVRGVSEWVDVGRLNKLVCVMIRRLRWV